MLTPPSRVDRTPSGSAPWTAPLRYAVIEITNRCNLRCPHCASSSGKARPGELSLAELRALVSELAQLGAEELTIIGGEALLRDDWLEICRAVVDAGPKLLLLTNGLRLAGNERALGALRELRPYLVGVSIDGASRESYQRHRGVDAFDKLVALCHRLVADGHPHVNAITTFWRDNLPDFDSFVRLWGGTQVTWQVQLASLGGERFAQQRFLSLEDYAWLARRMRQVLAAEPRPVRLRPMDDFGYYPLDPALAFLHDSWRGCIAGRELVGIRSNGDLLGCLSLGDEHVEGNIRRASLSELWRSPQSFERFRHKERLLEGHCASCPFGPECRAGCSAMAYSATGSLGVNPYCLRHLETRELLTELARARDPG